MPVEVVNAWSVSGGIHEAWKPLKEHQSYMWSVTDWRTDELFIILSNHEKGIYRELLDECWINGSIPDSVASLAYLCRESPDIIAALWPKISSKFTSVGPCRVTSARLERDRKRLNSIREERRKAGQSGGLAKAKQTLSKSLASATPAVIPQRDTGLAIALAKRSQTQTADSRQQTREESSAREDPLQIVNDSSLPHVAAPRYSAEFETFWSESTQRGSKLKASQIWERLNKQDLSGVIQAGMKLWQSSDQWQDETKQPHISTWLNRRGWEEKIPHGGDNKKRERIPPLPTPDMGPHWEGFGWRVTMHTAACGHSFRCEDRECLLPQIVKSYCQTCVAELKGAAVL